MSRVGVVVPTFNRYAKTKRFIECLVEQTLHDFTLYLVDSGSKDQTPSLCGEDSVDLRFIFATPKHWWASATNVGVTEALRDGCDLIMTINDDAIIMPDFLEKMVATFEKNNCKILGARIDYAEHPGRIWALGAYNVWGSPYLFQLGYNNYWEEDLPAYIMCGEVIPTQALCGGGVLISRNVFERIGFYREKYCPQYHADTEFTLRANRQGIGTWCATHVVLYNDASYQSGAAPAVYRGPRLLRELNSLGRVFFDKKSDAYMLPVFYVSMKYAPIGKKVWSALTFLGARFYSNFLKRYLVFLHLRIPSHSLWKLLYVLFFYAAKRAKAKMLERRADTLG